MPPLRNDQDNEARLAKLRPRYEALREQRIRQEQDVSRLEADVAEAERLAVEELGTSDVAEIRRIVERSYAANTTGVDAFEAAVGDVETRLRAVPPTKA